MPVPVVVRDLTPVVERFEEDDPGWVVEAVVERLVEGVLVTGWVLEVERPTEEDLPLLEEPEYGVCSAPGCSVLIISSYIIIS